MPWRRRLLLLALTASLIVLAGLIPRAEPSSPVPVSVASVGSPGTSAVSSETSEELRARAAQHTLLPTIPECPTIPQQISTWTPEQRVAQQLVSYWPPYSPDLPPLGGVMVTRVHGPDIDSVRNFTRALSVPAGTPKPLLVTDQEGGMVVRLVDPQLEVFASNAAISRLERGVQRASVQGETFADALIQAGIQANLAPVVDVATRANPVISGLGRAYSNDPEVVAAHATAFVLATQQQGRAATLKHFPGHGMVTLDSHQTLPTSDIDWPTLWRTHLYPYRTLFSHPDVRHDLLMVMTGHVRFSQLDNTAPASLSPTITTTLLRQQLGFDGVIITDALGMGALSGPIEERVVRALGAGADFALLEAPYHEQIPVVIDTLVARYDAEPARWWANAQSLRRIITLKAALGLVGTDANGCLALP